MKCVLTCYIRIIVLGKARGYTERVEYTGSDAGPIQFTFEIQRPQYLYQDKEHDKCRQKLTHN